MFRRSLALFAVAVFVVALTAAAAPAPHDLKVEMKAANTSGTGIAYPGPVRFKLRISNLGPRPVTGSYKIIVNKFDHTGQRWIKSVYTRDLPLLTPPGGDLPEFIVQIEDTAGDARTDLGTTFLYRATIGPGYYTDPVNANNKAEVAVRFLRATRTSGGGK